MESGLPCTWLYITFWNQRPVILNPLEEGGNIGKDVSPIIHQAVGSVSNLINILHMSWQACINEEKYIRKDDFLKSGRQFLVFIQNHIVLPHYDVPLLLQACNDHTSVLVIETNETGSVLVLQLK